MRIKVQDSSANYLIGFAKNKLKSCIVTRESLNEPIVEREYKTKDFRIKCHAEENNNYIHITGGRFKGFLCHPRTFNGSGWDKKDAPLTTGPYTFPLVDDDLGTRGIERKTEWAVSKKPENYGNLDWSGNGKVVSWRGPAGRQFAMDSTKPYPGFTEFDYMVEVAGLDVEHYTPYRNLVYQGGVVLKEFPYGTKVLGCALNGRSLVCVVGVDYAGRTNPDGGTGGFYDEVWIADVRIGYQVSTRPTTPWFFNSLGTEAVCGNQKVVIAEDLLSVLFSDLEIGSGSQNNEYTGGDRGAWGVTKSGSWPMFRDFVGLVAPGVALNLVFDERSVAINNSVEERDDLPIMMSGTDDPTVTISGSEDYAGEGKYSYAVSGNNCGIESVAWSYPSGCGMGTVSVTVTFLGGKTVTASMQVRMPTGMWVVVSTWQCGLPYPQNIPLENRELISGAYKTIIGVSYGTNCTNYDAPCWSDYFGRCVDNCVQLCIDQGFWPDRRVPVIGATIHSVTTRDGDACRATSSYNSYYYETNETVYEWRCS